MIFFVTIINDGDLFVNQNAIVFLTDHQKYDGVNFFKSLFLFCAFLELVFIRYVCGLLGDRREYPWIHNLDGYKEKLQAYLMYGKMTSH